MLDNFSTCLQFTLSFEGGFSNDPQDKGNWTQGEVGAGQLNGTNFGISAAQYPDLDIAKLTQASVEPIYRQDYWNPINGNALPLPVVRVAFDTAVNSGVKAAAEMLQTILGVTVDGNIGPQTVAAISKHDPVPLAQELLVQRILLDMRASGWPIYQLGWLRRAVALAGVIT